MREELQPAKFVDRFGADFIDFVIVSLVGVGTHTLVDKALLFSNGGFHDEHASSTATEIVVLLWFLWNLTYLVGKTGQSFGRRVSGLKVVTMDGDPIGFWRALGRNLFAMGISAPFFFVGFFWVVWDSNRQAWHDKVFRTQVLRRVVL